MKYLKTAMFMVVAILFTACGPRVQTERPVEKDLTQYETFAFLPQANFEVEGRRYTDERVNQAIVEAVNQNMRQAGYDLDRDNPDLLVMVSVYTEEGLARRQEPIYSYYPFGPPYGRIAPWYDPYYFYGWQGYGGVIGYTTDTYPYEEGTLIIDLVERETKQTVWKGILSEDIYGERTTAAVTDMINKVFEEFPVEK